ncbi:MAG: hypothetical protein ACKO3W_08955 [bacterium]
MTTNSSTTTSSTTTSNTTSPTATPSTARTLLSRFGWTLWALVPVGVVAYHFGPGQAAYRASLAAELVAKAHDAQDRAMVLQDAAYEAHLAAVRARAEAFGKDDPELTAHVKAANDAEDAAYATASAAWKETATILSEAQELVADEPGRAPQEIRLARARALVRTGDIAAGANDLEALLDTVEQSDADDRTIALEAREELATAYYYGARLMRMAGKPASEWREVSGMARQNFRYLAEEARAAGANAETIANHEKNGELVLDLEQSSVEGLFLKAKPKDWPNGQCNGLGKKPGNGKRPGKGTKPSKGAGMDGEIGNGW